MPNQEKFLEARIDVQLTFKEALDRIMSWTDQECRMILLGLLTGFKVGTTLREVEMKRKSLEPYKKENEPCRKTKEDLETGSQSVHTEQKPA